MGVLDIRYIERYIFFVANDMRTQMRYAHKTNDDSGGRGQCRHRHRHNGEEHDMHDAGERGGRGHRHRRGRHGPHGDMPWGSRRFFGAGEMRLALLSLLAEAPQHGYELMRRLEERLEGAYTASPGAIYPTLQLLEDEGLIAIDSAAGKKVCSLTGEGRGVVAAEAETIAALWARAADRRAVDFSDTPAMPALAGPLRGLLTAIKASARRAPDAAALAEIQAAIDAARERIDAIGR